MDEERLCALIGAIYDAALNDSDWPDVLERMGWALGSSKTALVAINSGSLSAAVQVNTGWGDESDVARYERDYAKHNPMILEASRRPYGSVCADTLLPDYEGYQGSAVYNEFFAPQKAEHVLGAFMVRDGGRGLAIAFHRGPAEGPHEPADLRLFGLLLPHLVRSFQLRQQFAGARIIRDGLGEALGRMRYAAVLVTAEARVLDMNERARLLLACEDGLAVRDRHLTAAGGTAQQELGRLIAATAGSGSLPPPPAALSVARPSCLRPYEVLITALPARDVWGLAEAALALVFIRDPEELPRTPADVLATLYGLTPTEALLASAIAEGRTVKEYAEVAKVTENTARWTLKQVLAKTETRSQADLVRLVHSGLAVLGASTTDAE